VSATTYRATITIGRDVGREGEGWAEVSVAVQGRVSITPGDAECPGEYVVGNVALVDVADLVHDLGDLTAVERQRADDALIAAFEAEHREAA
jgi:hypothetical protein